MKKDETERISTGISGFDSQIEGGFEKDSINLISGGSGSGKTIFTIQFLIEGIRRKEKVLFVTFEEKKEEFYKNMLDFGWDLDKLEKEGNFIFLEYSPEKVKQMLDEGGGSIESIVLKYKITRLVIDSITSFSLMFDEELSKRQAIIELFDIIRKWNCTTLLTVQEDPSQKPKGVSQTEFEADSITILYFNKIGNKRERFLEILKMRGTNHSKEMHLFTINKGIQVGKIKNKEFKVKKQKQKIVKKKPEKKILGEKKKSNSRKITRVKPKVKKIIKIKSKKTKKISKKKLIKKSSKKKR